MATHAERRLRAMGSDAHVIVVDGPHDAMRQAVARIVELERRWSRFIPTSEVCRLQRAAGTAVEVSPDTAVLVERAVEGWSLTGGAFDPTVLAAMLHAGYDADLDIVRARTGHTARETGPSPSCAPWSLVGCTDIVVDRRAASAWVTMPAGVGFDAGGIGKGLAADLVVAELLAAGAAGACVNLGGDVRVAGTGVDGEPWTIAVDHPHAAEPIALLGMHHGAVATSTTLLRRWQADGHERHHVIDPATGLPSVTDVELISVVTGEGWRAEVMATASMLRGSERVFDLLDERFEAMAVLADGTVRTTPGWAAFCGGQPVITNIHTSTSTREPAR